MKTIAKVFSMSNLSAKDFPPNFLWGAATSAYQIEGAAAMDGRGPSIWDTFSHTAGKTFEGHTGDVACNHYNLWADDLKLMQSLGLNAYRFSISWSRVQPEGRGAWNAKGLDFYDRLVDGLLERGMEPHVTLYHWDLPQALQPAGGWQNRDTASYFADYAAVIAKMLGNRVKSIATHNEPWCTAFLGHGIGYFAPGIVDPKANVQVAHHLLLSHGLALQAMRATGTKVPLGIVLNQSSVTAATDSPADLAKAEHEYNSFVRWYMDPIFKKRYPKVEGMDPTPYIQNGDFDTISEPLDFLGVNYYNRIWASAAKPPVPAPKLLGVTDMDWEIYPQGLEELLTGIHAEYKLPPVFITENGMANKDKLEGGEVEDHERISYMQSHIAAIGAAIKRGVDVRGFFYWSLMDNFEWACGYDKRFGIVHVDYATQKRTLKRSAQWYRNFIGSQKTA
jgi:beta-glucosidase